jgi:hypothetical protein
VKPFLKPITRFLLTYKEIILLCLVGICIRLPWLDFGLPQQYQPDEWAYTTAAFKFFKLNFINHGIDYPNLFMYLIFAAYILYFPFGWLRGDFTSFSGFYASFYSQGDPYLDYAGPAFFFSARLVSVLATVACGAMIAAWLYKKTTKPVALITAGLFLTLPMEFIYSRYATPDALLSASLLVAIMLVLRFAEKPAAGRWAAACIAGVCAACTKQPGAVIAAPLLAALWVSRQSLKPGIIIRYVLYGAAIFALGYAVLAPNMVFSHKGAENISSIVASQYSGNAPNTEGFQHGVNGSAWRYFLYIGRDFGPIIILCCLAGLAVLCNRRGKEFWIWFWLVVPYFAVFQAAPSKIDRYVFPLTTALALWTIPAGLETVNRIRRARHVAAQALVVAALLAWPLYSIFGFYAVLQGGDTRMQARAWLASRDFHNKTLAREIHYTALPPPAWDGLLKEEWTLGKYSIADLKKMNIDILMISDNIRLGFLPQSKIAHTYQSYFDSLEHIAHFESKRKFGFYNPTIDVFVIAKQ